MATVIGDVCAPTGKYIKDGEEKTSWAKCGVIMETDNGLRIKLDVIPVGGTEQGIWLSVFEKDNKKGQSQGSSNQRPSRPSQERTHQPKPEDDIPF
jgi:hypothetical protein